MQACCEQYYSAVCNYRNCFVQVLAWLRCKVKVLRNALVDSSASFAGLGSDSLTVYAVGLLGEYLSEEWTKRLADSCHVSLGAANTYKLSGDVRLCRKAVEHLACMTCGNDVDPATARAGEPDSNVHDVQISQRRRCSLSTLIEMLSLKRTEQTRSRRYALMPLITRIIDVSGSIAH